MTIRLLKPSMKTFIQQYDSPKLSHCINLDKSSLPLYAIHHHASSSPIPSDPTEKHQPKHILNEATPISPTPILTRNPIGPPINRSPQQYYAPLPRHLQAYTREASPPTLPPPTAPSLERVDSQRYHMITQHPANTSPGHNQRLHLSYHENERNSHQTQLSIHTLLIFYSPILYVSSILINLTYVNGYLLYFLMKTPFLTSRKLQHCHLDNLYY